MANRPSGFEHEGVGNDVVISHNARRATTLRGATADQFMADVEDDDSQELVARVTGNYKHGNERTAKNHPRNLIDRQATRRDVFGSVKDLNAKIHAFINGWNDRAHRFVWTQDRRGDPQEGQPPTASEARH